jgi:hypothetical protein
MMYLLQGSIIFAVCASNIRWQWTPNGYLAGLIGVGLAYGLTRLSGFGDSLSGDCVRARCVAAFNQSAPAARAESANGIV